MSYPPDLEKPSPAWVTGSVVTGLTFGLAMVGMYSFAAALIEISPWLAIVLLAVIIGGSAPTVWRFRERPVARWVVYGIAGGVATACMALVLWALFSA
ncbi:MAG: DUF2537 domain-containing protein [Nocardiaceae bacterium]|nr:DUF2537 domain-containing protein [Nocardiaceae bacterium]